MDVRMYFCVLFTLYSVVYTILSVFDFALFLSSNSSGILVGQQALGYEKGE